MILGNTAHHLNKDKSFMAGTTALCEETDGEEPLVDFYALTAVLFGGRFATRPEDGVLQEQPDIVQKDSETKNP